MNLVIIWESAMTSSETKLIHNVGQKMMEHRYLVINVLITMPILIIIYLHKLKTLVNVAQDLWIITIIQNIGLIAPLECSNNIMYHWAGKIVCQKVLFVKVKFEIV